MKEESYVVISFVSDEKMAKLYKRYKGEDKPTDVLSFEVKEKDPDGKFYVGDVVVNIDQAKRQAIEYGNTLEQEISELAAHGILHLQGVHHEGDA